MSVEGAPGGKASTPNRRHAPEYSVVIGQYVFFYIDD